MRKLFLALCLVTVCYQSVYADELSATQLINDIYKSCLSQYSTSCVKPKALAWISHAVNQDTIKINGELSIIRTGEDEFQPEERSINPAVHLFDKVDSFLSSHSLRIEVPQILKNNEARAYIPETFLTGGLAQGLQVPLVEGNVVEGRGFVKKVMIPFLLGLKFKTTVLVPLALALIALKTWKAMTLGLLSLVMTGAMVIFKFAKPKIVNYEVVHYPHPIEHVHAHPPPPHAHPIVFEPTPGWARKFDSQNVAYKAYL
ncbi:CLUMA_CG000825, isoform A [Clunio marinus]|uniref:CLUMA_CG000825, isoform A n=1 Tax=Clunio marinus TaxID=568069 RepID=A0A1J1HHS0_9DIPT|nr:CLUMA_CG000825, isoform A [Clunio marinus]